MSIRILVFLSAILLSLGSAGMAAAGKGMNKRAAAPGIAAKTTPRASLRTDVADQVKADMKGSKNFRRCETRACLHSHQH